MRPAAKPRAFVAYHHHADQTHMDRFRRDFCSLAQVFTDGSIHRAANSADVSYLARICREAIDFTSVTVVLIGDFTGDRKFVDWEIDYTLRKRHGLLAISRPGLRDAQASLPDRLIDNLRTGYAQWYDYPTSPLDLWHMLADARSTDPRLIENRRRRMRRNRQVLSRTA